MSDEIKNRAFEFVKYHGDDRAVWRRNPSGAHEMWIVVCVDDFVIEFSH